MAKIDPLSDVSNPQDETTFVATINSNSNKIEAALLNTLSRDGSTPNAMGSSLDMDSNRILNVGAPSAAGDAVNKFYVDDLLGGLDPELIGDLSNIPELVEQAQEAAADAAASAAEAAGYVGATTQAPKWTTARTITATGDISGVSQALDGTANISFNMTIAPGSVTGSKLSVGAAVSNLGYAPLNPAGGTLTGQIINSFVPSSSLDIRAVGFRGIPVKYINDTWAFQLDDCGCMIRHDSATPHIYGISDLATIPYPVGFAVMVRNVGAGHITLYRGPGVVLLKDGSGVNADVQVAQWGKALLIHEGSNIWTVGGSGIS